MVGGARRPAEVIDWARYFICGRTEDPVGERGWELAGALWL